MNSKFNVAKIVLRSFYNNKFDINTLFVSSRLKRRKLNFYICITVGEIVAS